MSRYLGLIFVALVLLSSCGASGIDPKAALYFGGLFMDDVINDRRDEMYSKMEPEFHDLVTKEQFVEQLGTVYDEVGKPSAYSLASQGIGVRTISAGPHLGQTKPTAELIYNVTTTKGVYPFKIKVVNSEGRLAVTYASFVLPN